MYTKLHAGGTRGERLDERRGFESWGADHVAAGHVARSDRMVEVLTTCLECTVGILLGLLRYMSRRYAPEPERRHAARPPRVEFGLYAMCLNLRFSASRFGYVCPSPSPPCRCHPSAQSAGVRVICEKAAYSTRTDVPHTCDA